MMNKKYKSNQSLMLFIYILVILLDLSLLYIIKYNNQNLALSEFNLFYIGNILNLASFLSIIVGLVIIYFKNSNYLKNILLKAVLIIINLFLLVCFISTSIQLPFKDIYFLGQNGNKFFIGVLFTLFNFSLFVLLFIVWSEILKMNNLILLRSMLNAALLMFFILFLVFIYIAVQENNLSKDINDQKSKSIGIVLGAAVWSNNRPSPSLSARVDKAIQLFSEDKLSSIYLTGSNAPGELSEAKVALLYIKKLNPEINNIYIEENTTSTTEQITFIKTKFLSKKNENIIVISDRYHLVRVIEIAKFHNISIGVATSDLKLSIETQLYNKIREALALTVFWFFAI